MRHTATTAISTLPHNSLQPTSLPILEWVIWPRVGPRYPHGTSMYSNGCRRGSLTNCSTPHLSSAIRQRPTHIVPPIAGAPPQVAKPTACNIWNHVRGVLSIPLHSEPRFTDTAPTVEELRWQLTQAVTAAGRTWILEAMAQHRHVAPPRKRPREPLSPPAPTPASLLCESREIHAGPFREQGRRAILHAQTHDPV